MPLRRLLPGGGTRRGSRERTRALPLSGQEHGRTALDAGIGSRLDPVKPFETVPASSRVTVRKT